MILQLVLHHFCNLPDGRAFTTKTEKVMESSSTTHCLKDADACMLDKALID